MEIECRQDKLLLPYPWKLVVAYNRNYLAVLACSKKPMK